MIAKNHLSQKSQIFDSSPKGGAKGAHLSLGDCTPRALLRTSCSGRHASLRAGSQ